MVLAQWLLLPYRSHGVSLEDLEALLHKPFKQLRDWQSCQIRTILHFNKDPFISI